MPSIENHIAENQCSALAARGNNKIEYIVVHYAADNGNYKGQLNKAKGTGGHYTVQFDGTIYQAADPAKTIVWHCRGQVYSKQSHTDKCYNENSIGIENSVKTDGNINDAYSGKWYFSTATQESLVWLVNKLMAEFNIPASNVIRHYDCTGKPCPAPYVANNKYKTSWTWDEFKSKLTGSSSGTGTRSGKDPRDVYLDEARKHIGAGGHAWVQSKVGIGGMAWCAATQCAIAKTVGYAGKIMPGDQFGAARFGYDVVEKYGGTYISGGKSAKPQKGDFCEFPPGSAAAAGLPAKYQSHHIAVVEKVNEDSVVAINGNWGNTYCRATHSKTSIGWYARPDWSKVGGISSGEYEGEGNGATHPLYQSSSTRADATIREVCYMTRQGEPSISKTDIKLSVINYTSILAELVGLVGGINDGSGGMSNGGGSDNIDGLPAGARKVVEFFVKNGFTTAAGVGVAANIQHESNFNTASIGDNGTSFGICQWHNERGTNMKNHCGGGDKWKSDLEGQLEYLLSELKGGYKGVYDKLMSVNNTEQGAVEAAEYFCIHFEVPANKEAKAIERGNTAKSLWKSVVIGDNTGNVSSGSSENEGKISGKTVKKTIVIPASVNQYGLLGNCTYYNRINWKDPCKRVFDKWVAKGKKKNHGIATIDGYYLVAMTTKFGQVGDLVSVILKDGTVINCVLGDSKGSSIGGGWGHPVNSQGQIDIIEWEAIDSGLNNKLKEWGIHKKKVNKVLNYGSVY